MPAKSTRELDKKVKKNTKDLRFIKKIVTQDDKYFDLISSTTPGTGGTLINIFTPTQGSGPSSVVGTECMIKNIELRYSATINGGATATRLRVALIQDKHRNGTNPSLNGIWATPSLGSFFNWFIDPDRYVSLYDKVHVLCVTNNQTGHWRRKLKKRIKIEFDAAMSPRTNDVYLIFLSNEVAAFPSCQYNTRVIYNDA